MSSPVRRHLRRLAVPRSRRSQLWACVYCGTVDGDAARDSDHEDARPARR